LDKELLFFQLLGSFRDLLLQKADLFPQKSNGEFAVIGRVGGINTGVYSFLLTFNAHHVLVTSVALGLGLHNLLFVLL